jgi:Replication protein
MQQLKLDGSLQQAAKPKSAKGLTREEKRRLDEQQISNEPCYWDYHVPPSTPYETSFRHSHWKARREKVLAALIDTNQTPATIERFQCCGSQAALQWSESEQRHRVVSNNCHNRHCEPCQKARASKMIANLKARLAEQANGRYRFITVTLKHSATPLVDQIKRLLKSFKALRQTPVWKESQRGGAYILEVKWSEKTREWHPHLHIVAEGDFVRREDLRTAWLHVTGDSHIVDIRKLDSAKDAAHYVGKYVTKGTNVEVWNDADAAQEWITGMKGIRVCGTFGTWRLFKLMANGKQAADWKTVIMIDTMMTRVAAGDAHWLNVYMHLPGTEFHQKKRA